MLENLVSKMENYESSCIQGGFDNLTAGVGLLISRKFFADIWYISEATVVSSLICGVMWGSDMRW